MNTTIELAEQKVATVVELLNVSRLHLEPFLIKDLSLGALGHKVNSLFSVIFAELIFVLKHLFCDLDSYKCVMTVR